MTARMDGVHSRERPSDMHRQNIQREDLEFALLIERRLAARYRPFSPVWDCARVRIEELERDIRHMNARIEPASLAATTS
jgi:hypothetical protein